jgi:serine/threonine-protein kinase
LLAPGTIVAGYRIDGVLGEGGMGTVYRATQLSLNRVVALKLLASELSDDPDFRTRFQREGQLQAALDHLHIVTVYEAGQADQGLFLAMQLVQGSTLKELIASGRLDARRSLRLLTQVAQALDSSHAIGVTHRDIKPQNILVGERDHAYLADFGLTTASDEDRLTGTGQFIGTIDYVSPEQIRGEPATAASDIYMLTGVLFECLTGILPYARPTETQTLSAHLTEPPPRVTDVRPELPAALNDVIAAGLAKDPARRPDSATALMLAATRTFTPTAPVDRQPASSEPIAGGGRDATRTRKVFVPEAGATALASSTAAAAAAAAAVPTAAAGAPAAAGGVAAGGAPAVGRAGQAGVADPTRAGAGAGVAPAADGARAAATAPAARGAGVVFVILGVLVLAAVAVGYLAGNHRSSTPSASFSDSASSGPVELSFPSTWSRSSVTAGVPGLTFAQPLTLSVAGAAPGTLTAGTVNGSGATLLPASFRALVQGAAPSPNDPVSIGSVHGYRYSGLQVKGLSSPVTLYVVPTSSGVVTLACRAGAGSGNFGSDCARVAATLRLSVTTYPLGPNPAYAKTLASTLSTLDSATSGPAANLRSASSASAQADAAASLATAYQRASHDLASTTVDPATKDANAALSAALGSVAAAYTKAATAARANDTTAYDNAGKQITSASSAITSALNNLKALGYSVQG